MQEIIRQGNGIFTFDANPQKYCQQLCVCQAFGPMKAQLFPRLFVFGPLRY
jgi:hypothetical protein